MVAVEVSTDLPVSAESWWRDLHSVPLHTLRAKVCESPRCDEQVPQRRFPSIARLEISRVVPSCKQTDPILLECIRCFHSRLFEPRNSELFVLQ